MAKGVHLTPWQQGYWSIFSRLATDHAKPEQVQEEESPHYNAVVQPSEVLRRVKTEGHHLGSDARPTQGAPGQTRHAEVPMQDDLSQGQGAKLVPESVIEDVTGD